MTLEMMKTDWATQLSNAFNGHPLPLSIVNMGRRGVPFIYVNRAFEVAFDFPHGKAIGTAVYALHGAHTETEQKNLFMKALKNPVASKLWITHCTYGGRPVLDLVAVQAVGTYGLCVHFPYHAKANIKELEVVYYRVFVYIIMFI